MFEITEQEKREVQVRVPTSAPEGCVPGTNEPEVCVLKTYERFALASALFEACVWGSATGDQKFRLI